jgi:DNA-binding beta-propeller fold protein YncE
VLTSWVSTNRRPLLLAAAVFIVTVAVGWPLAHRLASQSSPPSRPLPLRVIARTPLPGHDSRFDYAVVDPAAHRLFVDHMGDGTLLELDTRTDAVVATVPGLASVTGVIVVPALHRGFASAAGDGQVVTIDEDTAAVLARAPAGSFPDGLAYVPTTGQVWVSDEDGGAETVLDAHTGQRVATVRLGGEAGNVQYDATRDQVLVDVQTSDEVAVIDPHSRRITNRVPVPGCDHDHGLLVDGDRAFVACDGNNVLVTLSLPGLKPLRHVSVGDGPDVLAVDPAHQLLYVAAESGIVTTVDTHSSVGRVTGRAHLADNAHVVAVDPSTSRAYFPVPDIGSGHPGLLVTTPKKAS